MISYLISYLILIHDSNTDPRFHDSNTDPRCVGARGDLDAKHMSPTRALVRGKRLKWALILAIDSVLRPPYLFSFREFAAPCPSAQAQHHEIPGVLRVAMRATSFV